MLVNAPDLRPGYEGTLVETATFCKVNDDKRPTQVSTIDTTLVRVCPDDVSKGVDMLTEADPATWYARIEFDELLDPDIEDLVPVLDDTGAPTGTYTGTLADTQPVKLECDSSKTPGTMVNVPYDGYYSPSGNNATWPVGPSLVIKPLDPTVVATNAKCQITIKDNVVDKDGNKVPDAQRGPYAFKIAPIEVVAGTLSPADGDKVDAIAAGVDLTFNTVIDPSTLVAPVDPVDGTESYDFAPHIKNQYIQQESDTEFFLGGDFEVNGSYVWAMKAGAKLKDQCGATTTFAAGSTDTNTKVSFTTNPLMLTGIAPSDGTMNAAPYKHVALTFNQDMDVSTFTTADYSLTPTVPNLSVNEAGGVISVDGDFSPATDYTFTLKAAASVDDCPGDEATCVKSATGGTYMNTADQVIHFKTADIALTGTTPKDAAKLTVATATSTAKLKLTFNQDMDPTTLGPTEWSLSPAVASFGTGANGPYAAAANAIGLKGVLPAGSYTFTLKQGATIVDTSGHTFTNPADVVVHFTVVVAAPTPTHVCL